MSTPSLAAFGMWNGGHFLHFGEDIGEERLGTLVRRAYDHGIRTFLTADVYGNGEADRILGAALKGVPRESYCVMGAVGHDFYTGERDGAKGYPRFTAPHLRGPEKYADYIRMATEKALERAGLDRFDVLLLHNPDTTGYTDENVWKGLRAVRDAGLAAKLGIAPGPANGFTLDVIDCAERYSGDIDWAMIILNPLEPWPGRLCLPALEKHGVHVIARVVDHGGLFHGDMKPGHSFRAGDHRAFRPQGWVEAGLDKIAKMRPIADRHDLSHLHFASRWCLGLPAVKSVVPTLIQEAGPDARPIEALVDELAALSDSQSLTRDEVEEIACIGDNTGCMALKGATRQYQGPAHGDEWPMRSDLEQAAKRWGIEPDRDLYYAGDPRDLREKGAPVRGVPQALDRRLYIQLHAFTGARDVAALKKAVEQTSLEAALYASATDPHGVAVVILSEDPDVFVGAARELLASGPFAALTPLPEFTMFGRTYGGGREEDLEDWLLHKPRRNVFNRDWPWAMWYPLRRSGAFYRLDAREKGRILMEHGMIGRQYGAAEYAQDIRLECFGLDRDDNEFVIGLVGPQLHPLSKLIAEMRATRQTSEFMDKLGPFFIGKAVAWSRRQALPRA